MKLTKREKEICKMLVMALSYADIANILGITIGTTKQHAHNIYVKLNVRGRAAISPKICV